jgi:hypothetical protein
MSSTKGTLSAEAEEVDEVSCDDCCEIISEAARSSEVTKEYAYALTFSSSRLS